MNTAVVKSTSLWFRIFIFLVFLVSVNLLAGYIAVKFNYPSLFNVKASFWEYAIPVPFHWALAHIPPMLIYGVPLLLLPTWQEKHVKYFRIFCVVTFFIFLLELDGKNPFLLFFKVDALLALVLSLVTLPPNRKDNPKLVTTIKSIALIAVLILGFFAYTAWEHQTPKISNTHYANGMFKLKLISVNNDFRHNMEFHVEVTEHIPEKQACSMAQTLAIGVLSDYPFDEDYDKFITLIYNPASQQTSAEPYQVGEISLSHERKYDDDNFACYFKYKKQKPR